MWRHAQWLPADSPFHRALDPKGIGVGWTTEAYLLALNTEVADVNNVLLMRVNSEKGTHIRDPIRIPRPGVAQDEPQPLTGDELEAAITDLGGVVVKKRKKAK